MYELLSKRIKNADGEPEVFTYNSFPQAFRNQVFYILEDVLEPCSTYNENLWDIFEEKFCREKGLKGMGYGKLQNGYGKSSIEKYFEDCDDIDFLDAIDYFFYLIDKNIRTIKPEYQYDYDADGAINAAIAELNYRFKQHNLGYEFANSQIITIDSTFLHKTAVKPALKLLFEEGFEGAEDEIRNAYERRRKGDNKNAILEAGKAFESTMKIICDKQGYAYDKNKDTAQKLITILENNGFYPSYMNAHLTSIRTTLETGLPVVRNKVAGHGQGNQIITIPDEYTDYALHLAATNILFLVRLYRNKKQTFSSKLFLYYQFTTNRQYQLAQFCSDLPQSVISKHFTIIPETLAKQGISGQNKEKRNYDKNTICLPRQHLPQHHGRKCHDIFS